MGRTGQEWREGERRVGEIREGERMGWERGSSSFALGKKELACTIVTAINQYITVILNSQYHE